MIRVCVTHPAKDYYEQLGWTNPWPRNAVSVRVLLDSGKSIKVWPNYLKEVRE